MSFFESYRITGPITNNGTKVPLPCQYCILKSFHPNGTTTTTPTDPMTTSTTAKELMQTAVQEKYSGSPIENGMVHFHFPTVQYCI